MRKQQHKDGPDFIEANPKPVGYVSFQRRLKRIADNAIAEGVNTFSFILLLAGARWLVEHLFTESKFFDYVPVRYLFDVGDIAVIGRFIWNTLRGEE